MRRGAARWRRRRGCCGQCETGGGEMAAGEGVSVGSIFGRLGYRFDASGSQQFDQTRQKHEQETQKPIVQGLGFEVDDRALKAYHAELDKVRARTTKRDEFKAKLGADFDSRAFRQYE